MDNYYAHCGGIQYRDDCSKNPRSCLWVTRYEAIRENILQQDSAVLSKRLHGGTRILLRNQWVFYTGATESKTCIEGALLEWLRLAVLILENDYIRGLVTSVRGIKE
mmetsp:Transcript_9475/g.12309  ORF Transcript_9475/g.12309 Transcript_9475/m.12309 type:complete len:107 (-) Transcript_9475:87-407(-)